MDIRLIGPLYMGWVLGANDTANIFGTAVSSYMVKYKTAVMLTAIFVILGAYTAGKEGVKTLADLTSQTEKSAFIISLAAALTTTLMLLLKLPSSTSQAVVGAIAGIGIINGHIETSGFSKILICWLTTPLAAGFIAFMLYYLLAGICKKIPMHFLLYDRLMRNFIILSGIYGAYALGANNVANVSGVFYKSGILNMNNALLIGGVSIALGALTYSKKMMFTVGKSIISMDAFTSFVAVTAHSIAIHIYSKIGVPVSSSQAIVGALMGIGMLKGIKTVSAKNISKIFAGWFFTPVVGMFFCLLLHFISW